MKLSYEQRYRLDFYTQGLNVRALALMGSEPLVLQISEKKQIEFSLSNGQNPG